MTSPAPETTRPISCLLLRRIAGIALRHFYLYKGSWPRLVEMMYWPMIDIMLYGFISLSIEKRLGQPEIMTDAFLCGMMLVEILMRTTMGMMIMYMEEVWSRNLGHLFASPLRLRDFIAGLLTLSLIRCTIAVIPAFIAVWFLFDFSVLRLGWYLPVYSFLLCMNGWWYGILILAILMRFGLAAEWLGWMSTWALIPFMAATYPVDVLPRAFQHISWLLPGTYIFESMKHQIAAGLPRYDYLSDALGLNLLYFILAILIFVRAYRSARNSGGLLQMGE